MPEMVGEDQLSRYSRLANKFGSIRRECLDHIVIFNERHLRRILRAYFVHYNETRTHLALSKDAPFPRATSPPGDGAIVAIPQVGGLHHRYERRAAWQYERPAWILGQHTLPNKSIRVPELNRSALLEIQEIRMRLEGLTAEKAAESISDREIDEVEEHDSANIRASATGDSNGVFESNCNFHFSVYRAARSTYFLPIIEGLWLKTGPSMMSARRSGRRTRIY